MSRFLLNLAQILLWMVVAAVLFAVAIHKARRGEDLFAGWMVASGILAVAQAQDVGS